MERVRPEFVRGMKITHALRLPHLPRLAAVGAGGKSSLLFQVGRELLADKPEPVRCVLLTTSTHLASWQGRLADRQVVVETPEQVESLDDSIFSGLVVISGAEGCDQRLAGLDEATLEKLCEVAEQKNLPLLIEADGSRMRSLKAPGDHEPVIPGVAKQVVICAGMSGLGKPLSAEWVHRPERFARLAGLEVGQPITTAAMQTVLAHSEGGLKNIPPGASKRLVLTQADTPELQAQAAWLAEKLLQYYDNILICRGEALGEDAESLYQLVVTRVVEPVAGIVLAGGGATRFGQAKQLLDWQGKPFVRQVAETALQAGLSPVVVVVGAQAEKVRMVVEDLPVQVVENIAWEGGQATSTQCGIQALGEKSGAAIFLLSDQPQVTVPLIQSLVERHQQRLAKIIAPLIDGQRGNPVLFDRDTFADFASLRLEQGGRALFSCYTVEWLPWHDAGLLMDVDTPEDYARLVRHYHKGAG